MLPLKIELNQAIKPYLLILLLDAMAITMVLRKWGEHLHTIA